MDIISRKSDKVGATASLLCFLHCLLTPVLFLVQTCPFDNCGESPIWWKNIDYIFIIISFFAIYRSTTTTSKKFMIYLFWINWTILFLLITNEKFELFKIPEIMTYISAISLAGLHLYNFKYCKCNDDDCCAS